MIDCKQDNNNDLRISSPALVLLGHYHSRPQLKIFNKSCHIQQYFRILKQHTLHINLLIICGYVSKFCKMFFTIKLPILVKVIT